MILGRRLGYADTHCVSCAESGRERCLINPNSDFASSNKIEKAGQDILQSLQKAADVAEASRETARRLSHQLQNAENRIAQLENRIRELEAEVELYKAKMERAKQWLRTLFSQIEERLFG